MRPFILLLIGLALGAALTLIGMNALRKGTSYPSAVMAVMAAQMQALDRSVKQNRCTLSDLLPRLQTLRAVGNDLEPAFLPVGDDERFAARAGELRGALDGALTAVPSNCANAGVTLDKIQSTCQACHRDFKN